MLLSRAEIGDGSSHHHHVGGRRRFEHGLLKLVRGAHPDHLDPGRITQVGAVGRDQSHPGPALRRDSGQRVALPAGGPVAQVAHRVQWLARATGGDHYVPAGEIPRQGLRVVQ
jgi:hypothetical protein